jgi:DNA mismatch endonuclease, patch repair protein
VHGCFWHGHSCPVFKMPMTRTAFWRRKINQNVKRDRTAQLKLMQSQWRVLTVWECTLRGPRRLPVNAVLDAIVQWLHLGGPAPGMKSARSFCGS